MTPEITTSWWLALVPEISLLVLLVVVLIYDRALKPGEERYLGLVTAWGGIAALLLMFGLSFFAGVPDMNASLEESLIWGGMIRSDAVTMVFRTMFMAALITTSLISMDVKELQRGEYYALLITTAIGFNLMAASADLIMLYVSLETASISSYVLAGFLTKSVRSTEAGMKYFVYGAFATAVMLYGMSLLFGITGQTNLYIIGNMVFQAGEIVPAVKAVLLLAAIMIVVGFGYKISAVPFHFWTPDVYEGAPTPFTAYISTASKAAGFAIFLRLFTAGTVGLPNAQSSVEWWATLVTMCIATMTLGNFAAIFQNNIKRMLAYSSIAQAGYALIGLVTLTPDGAGASLFYLLMYVFTNVAAFGVIVLISNVSHSDDMKDLYGLNRRSPYLALVMMVALLSLGGIPPTAGFVGKFFIFKAAVEGGYWWLALIGILNAFVALYYYLGVIKYMYLYHAEDDNAPVPVSRAAWVGLGLSVLLIIVLGIYAGPAFDWTREAATAFYAFTG